MFYSKPAKEEFAKLPQELIEAFRIDYSNLMDKLPNKIIMEEKIKII